MIFGANFGKILASNKRPSEKMRVGREQIFSSEVLPNVLYMYLITKQPSLFFLSKSEENL